MRDDPLATHCNEIDSDGYECFELGAMDEWKKPRSRYAIAPQGNSWSRISKEPLKNVGGEALARRICQKKRSLHAVNEYFLANSTIPERVR